MHAGSDDRNDFFAETSLEPGRKPAAATAADIESRAFLLKKNFSTTPNVSSSRLGDIAADADTRDTRSYWIIKFNSIPYEWINDKVRKVETQLE